MAAHYDESASAQFGNKRVNCDARKILKSFTLYRSYFRYRSQGNSMKKDYFKDLPDSDT